MKYFFILYYIPIRVQCSCSTHEKKKIGPAAVWIPRRALEDLHSTTFQLQPFFCLKAIYLGSVTLC